MKVGTKSVLYGVHAFWLHPFFVAWAWWKLYGFPWDPRLWFAFLLHDIGYIGKPNMDGEEGEMHPVIGARIMAVLFDYPAGQDLELYLVNPDPGSRPFWLGRWGHFAMLHSRYLAKRLGKQPSRLCIADKMARATGEIREYMAHAHHRAAGNEALSDAERAAVTSGEERDWYAGVQAYMRRWVDEHRDGKVDTWTATESKRAALGPDGVWR
jgi:hypothetical protein